MALKEAQDTGKFLSILADGRFHMTVDAGTEGATLRTYETSTGEKGEKWERVFTEASGKITEIKFHDGSYGKNLIVTLVDGDEEPINLSFSCNSNYGEDVLKKLLNINRDEEVKFVPFSFTDDRGKNKKGVTVYQGDTKITSYFHDYDTTTKVTTEKNGYPTPPIAKKGKVISSDEWKLYFAQARMFMIKHIEEKLGLDNSDAAEEAAQRAFDGE